MLKLGDTVELKANVIKNEKNRLSGKYEDVVKLKKGEQRTIEEIYCSFHDNYTLCMMINLSGREQVSFWEYLATEADLEQFPLKIVKRDEKESFSAGDWITFTGDNQTIHHDWQYRPWITPLFLSQDKNLCISGWWHMIYEFQKKSWVEKSVDFELIQGKEYYVIEAWKTTFEIQTAKEKTIDHKHHADVKFFQPYICESDGDFVRKKALEFFGPEDWNLGENWKEEINSQIKTISETDFACPFKLSRTVDLKNIAAEPFAIKSYVP